MEQCADCLMVINPEQDQAHKVLKCGEQQTVCDSCFNNYTHCAHCESDVHQYETHRVTTKNLHYDIVCDNCYERERPELFYEFETLREREVEFGWR